MLVTATVAAFLVVACTSSPQTSTTVAVSIPDTAVVDTEPEVPSPDIEIGISDGVIQVGVVVPRSGPVAPLGEAVLFGQTAYWDYVNSELGGVGGRFEVAVLAVDSSYDPDTAEAGFSEFAAEVVGISGSLGTLIDERLASLAIEEGLLMMAGSLSSEWIGHDAMLPNLLLPTYRDQVAAGLVWMAPDGSTPAAVVFQEGSFGEDCARGYDRAVDDLGLTNVGRIAYPPAATDFGGVVEDLRSSGAEIVVLCATPDTLVRVIATSDALGFEPAWMVTAQSFDESIPAALGGDAGLEAGLAVLERTWVMGAAPHPISPAGRYIEEVFDGDEPTNWYTLFGYSQAATFHLILEEAVEGSDLSRPGLRAAAIRLDGIDLGLAGPLSSLVGPVPVRAAVGAIDGESILHRFGVPASEPYVGSPFGES